MINRIAIEDEALEMGNGSTGTTEDEQGRPIHYAAIKLDDELNIGVIGYGATEGQALAA